MEILMRPRVTAEQAALCTRFGVFPKGVQAGSKLGISRNVRDGLVPINGLRHKADSGTCGWYIWAGEEFPEDDGFVPLHVEHIAEWCPDVVPYLALPPGWRFLIAPQYEDVWSDDSLLNT
jgi:hypothetical protein